MVRLLSVAGQDALRQMTIESAGTHHDQVLHLPVCVPQPRGCWPWFVPHRSFPHRRHDLKGPIKCSTLGNTAS